MYPLVSEAGKERREEGQKKTRERGKGGERGWAGDQSMTQPLLGLGEKLKKKGSKVPRRRLTTPHALSNREDQGGLVESTRLEERGGGLT